MGGGGGRKEKDRGNGENRGEMGKIEGKKSQSRIQNSNLKLGKL